VGHYTNHSLCATAASLVYTLGVDKQLIIERTLKCSWHMQS